MANTENILQSVEKLIQKYDTRDPFELCKQMNIRIRYKDLGSSLKAFFFYQSRIKNIVINHRAKQITQSILCAHELGHAVLHAKIAVLQGFQEMNLFQSPSKTEYEANLFAAELLIEDSKLLQLLLEPDSSFFSIAAELYVPAELIDYKLYLLQHKGYPVEQLHYAHSDFLKKGFLKLK